MSMLYLNQYKTKNIHIVGIGSAEGSAIAEFLVMNGISSITGHDFSAEADFGKAYNNTHLSLKPKEREEALKHLLSLPIKINFKDHYLEGIENADMVFVSQVWFKYPQNLPVLKELYDKGAQFKTITNLYFELVPCKIISVTGTNGKTTTARLINSIFEIWREVGARSLECKNIISNSVYRLKSELQLKSKIYFAGNDRQNIQALDKLGEMEKDDVLILETSSTQLLLNSGISPHIGVITNITPNHIDDHGSFEDYIEAKKNLIRFQNKNNFAVLNEKLKAYEIDKNIKSKAFWFSGEKELEEGCFVKNGKIVINYNYKYKSTKRLHSSEAETMEPATVKEAKLPIGSLASGIVVCSIDDIKIPGKHNLENVLAAVSAAYLYGVDPEIIKEGVSKYTGIKHRLKLLYDINGTRYYDDTQATTPEAAIAGIESFEGEIILLAGGDNKGMRYESMAEKINDKIKLLILFPGDASEEIEKFIDKNKIEFIKTKNFPQAVETLKKYYKKTELSKNRTVLISPGAAHFYSKFVESSGKNLKEWIRLVSK